MTRKLSLAAFALAACCSASQAQQAPGDSQFAPGGKFIAGAVAECLNALGQAVPLFNASGAWQCAGPLPTAVVNQIGVYSEFTNSGADQILATPINGYEILNPDNSIIEICYASEATAAGLGRGAVLLPNGGGYQTPDGYKPIGAPHVICPTNGHKLAYRYW
jgi:hypothetical protein